VPQFSGPIVLTNAQGGRLRLDPAMPDPEYDKRWGEFDPIWVQAEKEPVAFRYRLVPK
jgi:hypothetical protein